MVRCNLTILLAERNLKITQVSKDTGISRTTLTYLANNYSKGIQYDTLNTLCTYLNITPGKLISHIPIEINKLHLFISGENNENLELEIEIISKGEARSFELYGQLSNTITDGILTGLEVDIYLFDPDGDEDIESENKYIQKVFSSLPLPFLKDLEQNIIFDIIHDLSHIYGCEDDETPVNTSFYWNDVIVTHPLTTE